MKLGALEITKRQETDQLVFVPGTGSFGRRVTRVYLKVEEGVYQRVRLVGSSILKGAVYSVNDNDYIGLAVSRAEAEAKPKAKIHLETFGRLRKVDDPGPITRQMRSNGVLMEMSRRFIKQLLEANNENFAELDESIIGMLGEIVGPGQVVGADHIVPFIEVLFRIAPTVEGVPEKLRSFDSAFAGHGNNNEYLLVSIFTGFNAVYPGRVQL